MIGDEAIGAMRPNTVEKWEFALDEVNFLRALPRIVGILIQIMPNYLKFLTIFIKSIMINIIDGLTAGCR